MSRLNTMTSYVSLNVEDSKAACYIKSEGYFCDKTEDLNRAVSCRTCPADKVKKWEDTLTCLDSIH